MHGLTGGRWRSDSHGEPDQCTRRETNGTEPDHLPLADQPAAYLTAESDPEAEGGVEVHQKCRRCRRCFGGSVATAWGQCNRERASEETEPLAFAPTLRPFALRLAKRTGEGQTSKGRVGAWSDHCRDTRAVDRDDGCLGLGRRRGPRVLCRGCAREDGRGHCRWTTHPASWPRLLRAPAARPPPRALTSASPSRTVEADGIIALPHALPEPRDEAAAGRGLALL